MAEEALSLFEMVLRRHTHQFIAVRQVGQTKSKPTTAGRVLEFEGASWRIVAVATVRTDVELDLERLS